MRFLWALIILSLSSLVLAVPPGSIQTNLNTNIGLQIYYPSIEFIKVGEAYRFEVVVSNISDGKELSNNLLNCTIDLHNSSGTNLLRGNFSKEASIEHVFNVSGGNFSNQGIYYWRVHCSDGLGGTAQGIFFVTPSGTELTIPQTIIYLLILLSLFISILTLGYLVGKLPSKNSKNPETQMTQVTNLKYLRTAFICLIWILTIILFNILEVLAESYLPFGYTSQIFLAIIIILICSGVIALIILPFKIINDIINDKRIQKMIRKGIDYG